VTAGGLTTLVDSEIVFVFIRSKCGAATDVGNMCPRLDIFLTLLRTYRFASHFNTACGAVFCPIPASSSLRSAVGLFVCVYICTLGVGSSVADIVF
jgi:hypothetical protein